MKQRRLLKAIKKALSGLILLAFQFSPFACSLYSCILCVSCICFVFVPYALTLPVSGLSFMSIKICVLFFNSV